MLDAQKRLQGYMQVKEGDDVMTAIADASKAAREVEENEKYRRGMESA